jgi:phage shock protein PspC (stress-responsive transcriptional regulator)
MAGVDKSLLSGCAMDVPPLLINLLIILLLVITTPLLPLVWIYAIQRWGQPKLWLGEPNKQSHPQVRAKSLDLRSKMV